MDNETRELNLDEIAMASGGKKSIDISTGTSQWVCPQCGLILKGNDATNQTKIHAHQKTHGFESAVRG
jgi:rubrerythrin